MNNYSDRLLNSAKKMHEKRYSSFVVCHNQQSYDYFRINNSHLDLSDFKFIQVGHQPRINSDVIYALDYQDNIEQHKTLLAFTAWYLIAKNNLCETKFVGIFEYDVKFLENPNIFKFDKMSIYGFLQRKLPDAMYLDCVPGYLNLLDAEDLNNAIKQPYWNATSNFIMPIDFLKMFVDWFMCMIPDILSHRNHSHYHERDVNVYAANKGYQNKTLPILQHAQLNSHKQPL